MVAGGGRGSGGWSTIVGLRGGLLRRIMWVKIEVWVGLVSFGRLHVCAEFGMYIWDRLRV